MTKEKKIVLIVLLVVAFTLGGLIVVAKIILPARMRVFISDFASEKMGYNVRIGKISYMPPAQYYLQDIILYSAGAPKTDVASLDGLSFSLKLWPFLKGRSIIASLGLSNLRYGSIRLNGFSSIYLKDLRSPARRPFLQNMDGMIVLKNCSLSLDSLNIGVEHINGTIILKDNSVKLSKSFFRRDGVIYNVEAALKDLDINQPEGTFSLTSEVFHSDGSFTFVDDQIKIKKVGGKFHNSSFNIKGTVRLNDSPEAMLYCEARLDLADIENILSTSKNLSAALRPGGQCVVAAFYKGSLKNIEKAEARLKLSSSRLSLGKLSFDDVFLDLRMDDGIIKSHRLSMRPYSGLVNASFMAEPVKKRVPFSFSFALKDADLKMVSEDMGLKKKTISGLLSGKLFLKGELASVDTLNGSGWVAIVGGRLWELPLLGGITKLLKMSYLESVVFREAAGNFVIGNRKISTDDLTFYSDTVNITAAGNLDFDSNLDFILKTNITQEIVEDSSEIAGIANLLLRQAGNYMGRIRVTGTLKDPKYDFSAKPIKKILQKGIKGLLRSILQ